MEPMLSLSHGRSNGASNARGAGYSAKGTPTMKTNPRNALPILVLLAGGCGGDAFEARTAALSAAPVRNDAIVHIPLFIRDAAGQIPTDPAALLFEARKNNPV